MIIDGAYYLPRLISWPAGSANIQLIERKGRLLWYAIHETSGSSAAQVTFRTGSDDASQMVAPLELAQSESIVSWMGDHGIPCVGGLFLQTVNGDTEGAVLFGELCYGA